MGNPHPDKSMMPVVPNVPGAKSHHHLLICTECGEPFTSYVRTAKTCSPAHRKRRMRRMSAGDKRDMAFDFSDTFEALDQAKSLALQKLPDAAMEVLKDELRPMMREAITAEVLESIGDMMELLPRAHRALADELNATTIVRDGDGAPERDQNGQIVTEADSDTRLKAAAMVLKYTVGQPGLAPQPEQPDAAPLVVNFNSLPPVTQAIEGSAYEDAGVLEEGQRQCDMCAAIKPAAEFVGSSDRCQACHDSNRERALAAIAERTKPRD